MVLAKADPTGIVVSKLANKLLRQIDAQTDFVNPERESTIPWFDRNEIVLNKMLGKGGFNSVYSIHEVTYSNDRTNMDSESQRKRRTRISNNAQNYVIKFLSDKTMQKNEDYANGSLDLVVEAKLLANLRHPNIIGLHGVSVDGVDGLLDRCEGNFFLVLDRLTGTLRESLQAWRKHPIPLVDRFQVGVQISDALSYLARKNVLHRDLKPENIGFTKENKAKLYDFGLAKVLPSNEQEFKLTAMTGTIRYMSPQVATKQKYGLSADVYSFSLLLWELASLETPFAGMRSKEILECLKTGKCRLSVKSHWPASIRNIISRGSDVDPSRRPTIDRMNGALKRQVARSGGEDQVTQLQFDRFQQPNRRVSADSTYSTFQSATAA